MGAWGTGSFDNDTACDWSYDLEEVEDLSLVQQTLAQALEADEDYLDADFGSSAIAACEVIARLGGNWGVRNSYTETVDQWVDSHPIHVPPGVVQQALSVIDRILSKSRNCWNSGKRATMQKNGESLSPTCERELPTNCS